MAIVRPPIQNSSKRAPQKLTGRFLLLTAQCRLVADHSSYASALLQTGYAVVLHPSRALVSIDASFICAIGRKRRFILEG
jgi:hypothetical protein